MGAMPPMKNDPQIQETTLVLQNTMLDMLRRRAVMQGLEERAIGKTGLDPEVLDILASDYLRSQLSDLRKFFDIDPNAHQVRSLTAVVDPSVKIHHDALYVTWDSTYKEAANKYFLHSEKGFTPPTGFSRLALDSYINEVNEFLDEIVSALTASHYSVAHLVRDINSGYLTDMKNDAEAFFTAL